MKVAENFVPRCQKETISNGASVSEQSLNYNYLFNYIVLVPENKVKQYVCRLPDTNTTEIH